MLDRARSAGVLAVLVLTLMAAGVGGGTVSAATSATSAFRSRALNSRLHFLIELPNGYDTSGLRYPVIYFLHGLPAGPTSYQTLAWVEGALEATGRQAILVIPQAASSSSSDPEYHDWGPGKNWETALAAELQKYIDAHYRSIASRNGRAIIGLSAGGYGATILGVHHPNEYAVIESWSGYFRPTDETGEKTALAIACRPVADACARPASRANWGLNGSSPPLRGMLRRQRLPTMSAPTGAPSAQ